MSEFTITNMRANIRDVNIGFLRKSVIGLGKPF